MSLRWGRAVSAPAGPASSYTGTYLQPTAPTGSEKADAQRYDATYLARLDAIVKQLTTAGIEIVLTPLDVPKWASDKTLWSSPQSSAYKKGTYYPFYAPDMGNATVRGQFKQLGAFLASRYDGASGYGKALYFECWNEPNQGQYLYPQTPASSKSGGGATYLKMLQQWYPGVKAGNKNAVVIAGATAPRGRGDAGSTPPQAFARYLKDHGAGNYMDAYSHHPYTPGGSTRVAPDQLPNNPDRCVTLGNLSQLTKLFPGKPFYLTEFGYNTQYSVWFGVTVSPADQARYLRQAYSYTASSLQAGEGAALVPRRRHARRRRARPRAPASTWACARRPPHASRAGMHSPAATD